MHKHKIILLLSSLFLLAALPFSCRKNQVLTGTKFEFSRDTIVFDTVFTTIGSTTRNFKVYNNENFILKFDEIRLMGGESSPFRFNFDGAPGILHENVEIYPNDSLFGFVDVTLSVNGTNLPMVVTDSIRFRSGGTDKYLILAVWGQDVYYHYRDVSEGTWPNDKPHLVYDFTAVDEDKTLTIQAGTVVYFHKNARFIVFKGALNIQGELDNEVQFRGDRLESFYENVNGQWYGLRFVEAKTSNIDYLNLRNSVVGLQVDSTRAAASDYTVTARNSQFYNISLFGIFPVAGARLKLENCVINNCGVASAFLYAGGAYNFTNCTFGNVGSQIRSTPLFAIKDNFTTQGITYVRPITEANFYNCVIWGSQNDELGLDILGNVNLLFDHCLIRNTAVQTGSSYLNCIWNQNPNFENAPANNLIFVLPSPLNNNGNSGTATSADIKGTPRTGPDIGAYEVP
jgi:hypothetical protein